MQPRSPIILRISEKEYSRDSILRMKRQNTNWYWSSTGFTLLEVMLAVIIIAIASIGLMKSVSYAKAELHSISLRDRAFQELTKYTNYWKARVAGYPVAPPPQVGGIGDEVILFTEEEGHLSKGYLYRRIEKITKGGTTAQYYSLKTWIEWKDYSFGDDPPDDRVLDFFCYQLVFPQ